MRSEMICAYTHVLTLLCCLHFICSWHVVGSTQSQTCGGDSNNPSRQSSLFESTMKAVRIDQFGGIENLKVREDIPVPTPADDEILIKMMAAGVNPVDAIVRDGYLPGVSVPVTIGFDGAGIVEEVGGAVKKFSKGDRVLAVFTGGSYAEYATAKEKEAHYLHESFSYEQGAGVGIPYYTAYASIHFKAHAQPGETVLVHGASGAVGIACIQILKVHGCRIIGTAGTPEGEKHVKDHGADFVYSHRENGYMELIKEEVTKGKGVDVILEMKGSVNLQSDLEMLAPRGRTIVIGAHVPIEINPRMILAKELFVIGFSLFLANDSEWEIMHTGLAAGLEQGWLKPYIGKSYSMEEAGTAHHDVMNGSGVKGKLVIRTS